MFPEPRPDLPLCLLTPSPDRWVRCYGRARSWVPSMRWKAAALGSRALQASFASSAPSACPTLIASQGPEYSVRSKRKLTLVCQYARSLWSCWGSFDGASLRSCSSVASSTLLVWSLRAPTSLAFDLGAYAGLLLFSPRALFGWFLGPLPFSSEDFFGLDYFPSLPPFSIFNLQI